MGSPLGAWSAGTTDESSAAKAAVMAPVRGQTATTELAAQRGATAGVFFQRTRTERRGPTAAGALRTSTFEALQGGRRIHRRSLFMANDGPKAFGHRGFITAEIANRSVWAGMRSFSVAG